MPKLSINQTTVKNGLNPSGSQKYRCNECKIVHTPSLKPNGYSKETKLLAVRMYVEGNSYGAIARILKVNPQSVANWVRNHTVSLPPAKVKKAELDELYNFVGQKKNEVYVLTIVDQDTRCVLSCDVVAERTSDAFAVYDTL